MLVEDDNASDYFRHQKKEKYPLDNKEQDVKKDQNDLVSKSSYNKNIKNMLLGYTPQNELFGSELSSSLKEFRFGE